MKSTKEESSIPKTRSTDMLVGTGPGAGMALMFTITGILCAFAGLAAYAFPTVRDVEDILQDHDATSLVPSRD